VLVGGAGADTLDGGNENDILYGGGGTVLGSEADPDGVGDVLLGGNGDDTIFAQAGDYVNAGNAGLLGDVVIVGGTSGNWSYQNAAGTHLGQSYTATLTSGSSTIYLNNVAEAEVQFDSGLPCYLEGTRIMTARGEVAVEALRVGDLVVTAHGQGPVLQPVVWVGRTRVHLARHPRPELAAPILVRAGALGENAPHRDLRVSPEHAMFVEGRLVPAGLLVNGTSIVREPWWQVVTWYHVELPAHGLLMAEGAPAESYFDAGNRHLFGNGGALAALFPNFAAGRDERRYEDAACFPLLREEGPALDAIRAGLATRAAAMGAATRAITPADTARPAGWAIRMPAHERRLA
jgi:hypothetical protein